MEKRDVSDEIELKNGRASLMWSQKEIWHNGKRIGWLESGCPMDFIDGYSFEITKEPNQTRLTIYCHEEKSEYEDQLNTMLENG